MNERLNVFSMDYPKNSSVMERRLISERRLLREQRLQQYNEMKPVLKHILGSTVRVAGKMIKFLFKTAFRIPGLVKRMSSQRPPTRTHTSS